MGNVVILHGKSVEFSQVTIFQAVIESIPCLGLHHQVYQLAWMSQFLRKSK